MTVFSRRIAAALAALFFLAGPAIPAAPVARPLAVRWAQATSDLPVDPSVRFGTLPNGMRYAIKRNTSPKGAVSLRFRFDVGSLMERDDEQGIAHMLEHMAFRGSKHVADGDTVRILQSLGLTFGADTNAFTAATETVYSFDMPKNDAASIDTALMLMREIGGNLNITQAALDTERNVVLAEAHLRDVPVAHLRKADFQFLYGDRAAAALTPIGLEPIISHATAKLVRDFYDAWYRPERATLIIVGDVDPAEIEAKIKAKFSDWKPRAKPRPVVHYLPPAQHPLPVRLFQEAGVQPYILFSWLQPYDSAPDTKANEQRDVIRFIALSILNQRMTALAHQSDPPFIAASASHDHMAQIADFTELAVSYQPGHALDAAKAAERQWREALAHGVRQDEVDSVIAQLRSFFQSRATAADTTPSPEVIDALLRSVDERTVFTSPASDLTLYDAAVKGLTAAKVSEAFKYLFGGTGPLVFLSTPSEMPGGEAQLRAALAQADGSPLAANAFAALPPWPYTDFGKPGTVVAQTTVPDLDLTNVTFSNGVTLTIKPTALRAGQILMNVRFGTGRSGFPRDHVVPSWAIPSAFVAGGLKRYSIDDLQKRMAGRLWGAQLTIGDDDFSLTGQARAIDLDSELQVLAAYVADPAFRPEAFEQVRTAYASSYESENASPSSVLSRELYGMLHAGDVRWRAATEADIAAAKPADEAATLQPSLQSGPLEVTMVGDITVEQAIAAVARTFGALPQRTPPGPPLVGDERFPAPTPQPVLLTHTGAANQAMALIAWPTTGFFRDMKQQRTLRVLAEILSQRLLDELRTREGITYTPGASSYASLITPDYGFVYALAQVPPDKVATFYTTVTSVAADLAAKPVGADELERARGPRIEDIERLQQTNEYWLGLLAGSRQDPRLLDIIRSTIPDQKSITAADIQAAARAWLKDGTAYRVVVMPEGIAPPKL